jgi:hypothetical protein
MILRSAKSSAHPRQPIKQHRARLGRIVVGAEFPSQNQPFRDGALQGTRPTPSPLPSFRLGNVARLEASS